jgi:hypothetical protein
VLLPIFGAAVAMKTVAGTGRAATPLAETVPLKSGRACEFVIRRSGIVFTTS